MAFVEAGTVIPDVAPAHDQSLLREVPVTAVPVYKKPQVLVKDVITDLDDVDAGCSEHPDSVQVPFDRIEDSYHHWEKFLWQPCGHPGCFRSSCLRINIHGQQNGQPYHTLAVSRQRADIFIQNGRAGQAYQGENIRIYISPSILKQANLESIA